MSKYWSKDASYLLAINLVLLLAHIVIIPFLADTVTIPLGQSAIELSSILVALTIPVATTMGSIAIWIILSMDTQPLGFVRNHKVYRSFVSFIIVGFDVVGLFTLLEYQGFSIPTEQVIITVLGLVLLLVGNILPKVKPNYVLGVRNPFTLADDVVWIKTHQMTGYLNTFGGLFILLTLLIPSAFQLWVIIGVGMGLVIIPFVYSLRKYKQIEKRKNQENVED